MKTAEEIYNTVFKGVDKCYHFPELKQLVLLCVNEFANQSKWISVEDVRPTINTEYLVLRKNRNIYIGIYEGVEGWDIEEFSCYIEDVTHYQPLPEKP